MRRNLKAILSADVKDYSRLMGDSEELTIETLVIFRDVISNIIHKHEGRVVDSPGDNLLADFFSAQAAVTAALEIQAELANRNTDHPMNRQMQYRIGINVGEIIEQDGRIYGDAVNIAARLESLARPGGIAISGTVHDQIKTKLDIKCVYQGEQQVKNISSPIRMYNIVLGQPLAEQGDPVEPHWEIMMDKPSLAVLPFTNLSNDQDQEYFSDGMTDDLLTDLSKVSGLFVIARHSTFFYKGKAINIKDVSRDLGARYILEGSVRRLSDQIRVNVQLIDGATGGNLWANRYDRAWKEIFDLQDEITAKVVFALKVKLSPTEKIRFQRTPTENLEAYDHFLMGESKFWEYNRKSMSEARDLLWKAIALDSSYAAAYAVIARTYITEWSMYWKLDDEVLVRAVELAKKAVSLDEGLAWAHASLGVAYGWTRRHREAITSGEMALIIDPNFADGMAALGYTFIMVERHPEAIQLIEKAMRLNPFYPFIYKFFLGCAYYGNKEPDRAQSHLRVLVEDHPDFVPAHAFLAACYVQLGEQLKGVNEIREVRRINPSITISGLRKLLPYENPEPFLKDLSKAGLV